MVHFYKDPSSNTSNKSLNCVENAGKGMADMFLLEKCQLPNLSFVLIHSHVARLKLQPCYHQKTNLNSKTMHKYLLHLEAECSISIHLPTVCI